MARNKESARRTGGAAVTEVALPRTLLLKTPPRRGFQCRRLCGQALRASSAPGSRRAHARWLGCCAAWVHPLGYVTRTPSLCHSSRLNQGFEHAQNAAFRRNHLGKRNERRPLHPGRGPEPSEAPPAHEPPRASTGDRARRLVEPLAHAREDPWCENPSEKRNPVACKTSCVAPSILLQQMDLMHIPGVIDNPRNSFGAKSSMQKVYFPKRFRCILSNLQIKNIYCR